jgi:predicted MPP superfamily phosphohydrolase
MKDADAGDVALARLQARFGASTLQRRLRLEDGTHGVAERRWSRGSLIDGIVAAPGFIRAALRLAGLHARGQRNALDIRCREHEVRLARLPSAFDGYTLLQLSDLHLGASTIFVDRLIARVQSLRHDLCVLTGDYRWGTAGPWQPAVDALARLRPHLGETAYAVLGNHDTIRMVPSIEALGIGVLLNESACIHRAGGRLTLAGIDDAHHFRTDDLQKALAGAEPGGCTILLSHAADPFRQAAQAGVGLMLSGHTHGGQICLPGGMPVLTLSRAPRALARGPWRHGAMAGYTSAGCGTSVVDVRLNCLPEVTLHRLRCL